MDPVAQEQQWLSLVQEAAKGLTFRPISADDYLVGPEATIDSLDFLNFLVRLEVLAAEKFGKFRPIVEEAVLEKILRDAHQIKDLIAILANIN